MGLANIKQINGLNDILKNNYNYRDIQNDISGYTITQNDNGVLFCNGNSSSRELILGFVPQPLSEFRITSRINLTVLSGVNLILPDGTTVTDTTFNCDNQKHYICHRYGTSFEWKLIETTNMNDIPSINFFNGIENINGTFGIGGTITEDTILDLDNNLTINSKDLAKGSKFTFLTSNFDTEINKSLFSVRSNTSVLQSSNLDLFVGSNDIADISSSNRVIFGSNNVRSVTSNNSSLTIIGNNNANSYVDSTGYTSIVGYDNLNSSNGNYNSILGTGNISSATNSVTDTIAIGTWNAHNATSIGTYNIFLGEYNAFNMSGSIGDENTFLGTSNWSSTEIGKRNVFLGYSVATSSGTVSSYNTFIGAFSARDMTSLPLLDDTDWNTAIGASSMRDADGSNMDNTTAIGASSLRFGGGQNNTAVGRSSGWEMKGKDNTSLGSYSGKSSDSSVFNPGDGSGTDYTGERSTFVGFEAGYDSSIATQSDVNVFGSYTATEGTSTYLASKGDLYLVNNTNGSELKLKLPNTQSNSGQVLSDISGNGELGWKDVDSHIYSEIIFLDNSVTLGTGQIGNINKPYRSIVDAQDSNGGSGSVDGYTFYCLSDNCVGNVASNNATILGNGFSSNVSNGSGRTVTVRDIIMSSGQQSGGANVSFYNCTINGITYAFGGANLFLYDCIVNTEISAITIAKNCIFNDVVSYRTSQFSNNTFNSYIAITDRAGGVINDNIFNTPIGDVPIKWQTGFNSSQSGGKVIVSNNLFNTDNNLIIEEYNNTSIFTSMKMHFFSNRAKNKFNYNLTVNEIIADFDNETIEDKGFEQSNTVGTFVWDSREPNKSITLTGNTILDITNTKNGDSGTIILKQDATGGRTLTLPVNSISRNNGNNNILSGSNETDILQYYYDGTDYIWTYGYSQTEKIYNDSLINSDSPVSLSNVYKGHHTIDVTSTTTSPKLSSVSYEVSLDDETFTTQSTLNDVQLWVDANISVSTIWTIRTIGVFNTGKIGDASTKFKMEK